MVGPNIRDAESGLATSFSGFRNDLSRAVRETIPTLEERNVGEGRLIALQLAPLGFMFGGTVDIEESESVQGGTLYTVNVNSVSENAAVASSYLSAGNGIASYVVDRLEREDVKVQNERILVDTYEVKVFVGE